MEKVNEMGNLHRCTTLENGVKDLEISILLFKPVLNGCKSRYGMTPAMRKQERILLNQPHREVLT